MARDNNTPPIPAGFKPVPADAPDLVERQHSGQLYWLDPKPLPPSMFGGGQYRVIHLNKYRHDFTLSTLKKWGSLGQLLERENN